jgi:DNA-binding response OmpR family regulator
MFVKLDILLVEDTPGDAAIIEFYLAEQYGEYYNFFHVDKFKDCLQELKIKKYDIVLLDLDLPDSHGIDTLKTLMQTHPDQLVIVLTGLNDEKTGLKTLQKGANDYMVKGKFDAETLNSKIKFALERYLTKIKSNKTVLHQTSTDNILSILNAGYVEIDKTHLIITQVQMENLAHIFELPIKNIAHFCSFIDDCDIMKNHILGECVEDTTLYFDAHSISGERLTVKGMYSKQSNIISLLLSQSKD